MALTGKVDVDRQLLMTLRGEELMNTINLNNYTTSIANDGFWRAKLARDFDIIARDNSDAKRIYEKVESMNRHELIVYASIHNHLDAVKRLYKLGANVDYKESKALRGAARRGYGAIVEFLVDHEANIHTFDDEALRIAAKNGHGVVVKVLCEHGANICARDDEAVRIAATGGHIDVVKILIAYGANIRAENDDALCRAAHNGHSKLVKYLISIGANPTTKNNLPITYAAMNGHLDTMRLLARRGAKIDGYNQLCTILRQATRNGLGYIVQYFVNEKTDKSLLDYLIQIAARFNHKFLVSFYASLGANTLMALAVASAHDNQSIVYFIQDLRQSTTCS